jgi:hypothetical protein
MFFIIISALSVSGGFSALHQEFIKLYVQPWVLSCFPAVYRWCGWIVSIHRERWCGWIGTAASSSNPTTPAVDSRKA